VFFNSGARLRYRTVRGKARRLQRSHDGEKRSIAVKLILPGRIDRESARKRESDEKKEASQQTVGLSAFILTYFRLVNTVNSTPPSTARPGMETPKISW
jgi:hypothetical protein